MATNDVIREYNIRKRSILDTYNSIENLPGASKFYDESMRELEAWADEHMREANNGN